MSWLEIERDKLLNAIAVLDLVPQITGIPSSDYICVTPKKSGIELALASSVSGVVRLKGIQMAQGVFYIDRKLFVPFVQIGKEWKGNFRIQLTEDKLMVRQSSRQAEFLLRKDPISGYVGWKDRSGLKEILLSEELRKMLLASSRCATGDPAVPHLNCVYIGGKLVLSTNLISLFVGMRQKEDSLRFPFPVGVIPLLGDALVKAVGVENDRVILDCGCGYVEGTISAVAQKSFPKKDVVQKIQKARTWPLLAKISAEKLSKILSRLTRYLTSVKREDWSVELTISNGQVKATVQVQQGRFEEKITLDNERAEGTVRWPLELAQAVVEYMATNGETIKIRVDETKNTPYLLSGGGVEMMIARQVSR